MEYKGVLLSEQEKKKYLDGGKAAAAIIPDYFILKKTVFRGPEAEVYKLLNYVEETYGVKNSVNYISEDIVDTSFDEGCIEFINKFPMLKVMAFVLELDKNKQIIQAGVIYIPSGYTYPSKYERLVDYHFDVNFYFEVIDSSFSKHKKSYMWPILKNPCEDFTVRYNDFDPDDGISPTKTQLMYKFRYSYEWNDNEFIYNEGEDYYRLANDVLYDIADGIIKSISGDIKKIVIPKDVKVIAPGAFKDNDKVNSIHLSNVTEIGDEAFANCPNLKHIEFSESLDTVGDEVFAYCERIDELIFPDKVKSIGDSAFFKCGVGKIVWPKGVTTIPMGMFRECRNLYEIYIPPEVTTIERRVFCRSNTVIIYGQPESEAERYAQENNMYFKPYNFN